MFYDVKFQIIILLHFFEYFYLSTVLLFSDIAPGISMSSYQFHYIYVKKTMESRVLSPVVIQVFAWDWDTQHIAYIHIGHKLGQFVDLATHG